MIASRTRRFVLRSNLSLAIIICLLTLTGNFIPAVGFAQPPTAFRLTVWHHGDGESQLINAGGDLEDFGGVAVRPHG